MSAPKMELHHQAKKSVDMTLGRLLRTRARIAFRSRTLIQSRVAALLARVHSCELAPNVWV